MRKVDESRHDCRTDTRPREETVTVDLLRRAVPAKHTDEGLRALSGESPIHPESVRKYLEGKFGDALEDGSSAMLELAKSLPSRQLPEKAYALYKKFRPEIPPGEKGVGRLRQVGPGPNPQDGLGLGALDIRVNIAQEHPEKRLFLDLRTAFWPLKSSF